MNNPDILNALQDLLQEQKRTNELLETLATQEEWKREWWQNQFSYPIQTREVPKERSYY